MTEPKPDDIVTLYDHGNPPDGSSAGPYDAVVTEVLGSGPTVQVNVVITSLDDEPRKHVPKSPPHAEGSGKYFIQQ